MEKHEEPKHHPAKPSDEEKRAEFAEKTAKEQRKRELEHRKAYQQAESVTPKPPHLKPNS